MAALIRILAIVVVAAGGLCAWFAFRVEPQTVQSIAYSIEPTGKELRTIPGPTRIGRRLYLTADIWFYCYPPTGELILVEEGYLSDFASIPAFASWFADQYDSQPEPAVIHDWLYAVGEPGRRKFADDVFLYAMKQLNVPIYKRAVFYAAVRLGGAEAYGRASEWNFGRPDDPWPEERKPAKPASAVVDVIDCERDFGAAASEIRRQRGAPVDQ